MPSNYDEFGLHSYLKDVTGRYYPVEPMYSPYDELQRRIRDLTAQRDEALEAVREIAQKRTAAMLGGFRMEYTHEYDVCRRMTHHSFDLQPVSYRFTMTDHPLDTAPAIVVEMTLRNMSQHISEQFATRVYSQFAKTQGKA